MMGSVDATVKSKKGCGETKLIAAALADGIRMDKPGRPA
jgi:hypothetical protein